MAKKQTTRTRTARRSHRKPKPAPDEKVVRLCCCGCQQVVAGRKSNFFPGHDARLKSMLMKGVTSQEALDRREFIKFVQDPKYKKLMDAAKVQK